MTKPISNLIQSQMQQAMPPAMASGVSVNVDMGAPGLFHTPQSNLGLYHESTFDLSSRLKATLGLRYDFMHTSIHYDTYAYMAITAKVMGKEVTVLCVQCSTAKRVMITTSSCQNLALLPA